MTKVNVAPFDDLRHLLRETLQSAMAYEQDLIDCGGYMEDTKAEKKAVKKIAAQQRLLNIVAPGRKTHSQELDDMFGELIDIGAIKMMTLEEIKIAHRKQEKRDAKSNKRNSGHFVRDR